MNREIKFRAYDNECQKMFSGELFVLSGNGELWVKIDTDTWQPAFNRDITVMQYTGLTDKNGVEIYEGDILKRREENRDFFTNRSRGTYTTVLYITEWIERDARYKIKSINKGFYAHDFNYGNMLAYYEVIGNIYENKELLGETQ